MTKMWAVSSGEYSDYGVICVCATEELAEEIVRLTDDGGYNRPFAEEFDIATRPPTPHTTLTLKCYIGDDNRVIELAPHNRTHWQYEFERAPNLADMEWTWRRPNYLQTLQYNYGTCDAGGELTVVGTDHERVRRVYSDRKAELIALPHLRESTHSGNTKRHIA